MNKKIQNFLVPPFYWSIWIEMPWTKIPKLRKKLKNNSQSPRLWYFPLGIFSRFSRDFQNQIPIPEILGFSTRNFFEIFSGFSKPDPDARDFALGIFSRFVYPDFDPRDFGIFYLARKNPTPKPALIRIVKRWSFRRL